MTFLTGMEYIIMSSLHVQQIRYVVLHNFNIRAAHVQALLHDFFFKLPKFKLIQFLHPSLKTLSVGTASQLQQQKLP